ncbi:MAG: hypothetical protein AABW88_01975 [Nanoarchaeota archaeon]
MKIQVFGMIALLLFAIIVAVPANATLSPLGITVNDVKVEGDSITANQTIKTNFERNSDLELKISLQTDSSATVEDVVVQAFITGARDKISDETDAFDVQANTVYTKTLSLDVPERTANGEYQLRVIVSSPNSNTISYVYPLLVSPIDNSVAIKDVTFSPNAKVMAGRALTAVARLKNYGQKDENDVKVVFSIPELNVQETDYIDSINNDDTESTEEVLLRIPATAKSGTYDVEVNVYFNDGDDRTSAVFPLIVEGDDYAAQAVSGLSGKTIISVGLQTQSVARGENGVIYPLSLTNGANVAKTYTLSVSGTDGWAVTKVSPSNVLILNAGETKQAYVYVAANENSAVGEHVFSVDVKVGNDVVQQIPMKADVLESAGSAWAGVKKALSVGVILLVVLIIALGAVILYQKKFKPADETKEDEQIAQTYY